MNSSIAGPLVGLVGSDVATVVDHAERKCGGWSARPRGLDQPPATRRGSRAVGVATPGVLHAMLPPWLTMGSQ